MEISIVNFNLPAGDRYTDRRYQTRTYIIVVEMFPRRTRVIRLKLFVCHTMTFLSASPMFTLLLTATNYINTIYKRAHRHESSVIRVAESKLKTSLPVFFELLFSRNTITSPTASALASSLIFSPNPWILRFYRFPHHQPVRLLTRGGTRESSQSWSSLPGST